MTFLAGLATIDPIRREGRLSLEGKAAASQKLMSDIQAHLAAARPPVQAPDDVLSGIEAKVAADEAALRELQATVARHHP